MSKRKSWEERKRRRLERIVSEFEIVSKDEIVMRWDHILSVYQNMLVARDPGSRRLYFFQPWDGQIYPIQTWSTKAPEGWEMPAFELLFLGLY